MKCVDMSHFMLFCGIRRTVQRGCTAVVEKYESSFVSSQRKGYCSHIPSTITTPWNCGVSPNVLRGEWPVERRRICYGHGVRKEGSGRRFYGSHKCISSRANARKIEYSEIQHVFHALEKAVKLVDPGKQLYLLGSTAMFGVLESGSDVDCVALSKEDLHRKRHDISVGEQGRSVHHEQQQELLFLSTLHPTMEAMNPGWEVHLKESPVPVLRLRHASTGGESAGEEDPSEKGDREGSTHRLPVVDIDITANRIQSLHCTHLIRQYLLQHPFARWLSIAVKAWGKQVGIHSKCKSYSPIAFIKSHGFILMVIYYFLRRGGMHYIPPQTIHAKDISPLPPPLPPVLPLCDTIGVTKRGLIGQTTKESVSEREEVELERSNELHKYQEEILNDFFLFYAKEFDSEQECIAIHGPHCSSFTSDTSIEPPHDRVHVPLFPMQRKRDFPPEYNANLPWSILDPVTAGVNLGDKITKNGVHELREIFMQNALNTKEFLKVSLR